VPGRRFHGSHHGELIEEMQNRIDELEPQLDDAEFKTCTTMEQFRIYVAKGQELIILSVPYKGRNTVGVYRAEINTSARNIVFSRIE
jgi:hypothetical protein